MTPDKLQAFATSQIDEILNHFFSLYPDKRYDLIIAGESTHPTLYHKKLGDPNLYRINQYQEAINDILAAGRTRATDGKTNGDRLANSVL